MRCPYCGNENPDEHRFCGLCGRALPEPTAELPAAGPVAAEPPVRRAPEPTSPAPAYTGGIFNLGAPAESSSRNLDYLLDDDDEPKSSKVWVLLVVVALALVVGLGWLRWRREGLPLSGLLTSGKATSAAGSPNADASASATTPPESTASTPAPTSQPAPTPSSAPSTDAQPPAATPSAASAPSTSSPTASSPAPSASSDQPATKPPSDSDTGKSATVVTAPADTKPAETTETTKATEAAPTPPPEAKPAPHKPAPPPAPKPAPKPADPVALGEQYLYGRNGVPQNCERGLRYVKPAADQAKPKAMITMGALYATGHCLSRDLPTAYRYFALALREDPENGPLRQNVDMVWKQMTAEERKQAIRLTQ